MKKLLQPFASVAVATSASARLIFIALILTTSFSKAADQSYEKLPIDLPAVAFLPSSSCCSSLRSPSFPGR